MDFSGLDKLKINNVIVGFLILINCVLFPLTILLVIDYRLLFNNDLLKTVVAALCVGCANFGVVYSTIAFILSVIHNINDLTKRDFLFQRPLVMSLYVITIAFIAEIYDLNLHGILNTIKDILRMESRIGIGLAVCTFFLIMFNSFKRINLKKTRP